jgi:Lon protease-like protein
MTSPAAPVRELAMFPLGSVLFPSVVLPLHVFEPRYRAMAAHLLGGSVEPEFGVVLIERGSEVGGGDQRGRVGTLARIAQASELPDGRWAVVAFGVTRLRVVEWLPDDPWPRAQIEDLPDDPPSSGGAGERWQDLQAGIRRVLGLAAELGEARAPATIELATDPALGSFQAGAALPIGPLDQQRVLATAGVDDRLGVLEELVADQAELLEARLRLG